MIIQCKSCEKKFVVADNAIPSNGRLVQCSSCGNKWMQFQEVKKIEKIVIKQNLAKTPKIYDEKININKKKKRTTKIRKKPTSYTNEYLQKKHGIKINTDISKNTKKIDNKKEIYTGLGFYSYLIIFSISIIFLLGVLHLTKEFIILTYPNLENYINYLFETINYFKVIILDIISNY